MDLFLLNGMALSGKYLRRLVTTAQNHYADGFLSGPSA
jgi:hypothetical protein